MELSTYELKLKFYGDPCLRKKSASVQSIGTGERMLIQAMISTMHKHKGIGLAAPQVGINEQIFVVDIGQGPFVVINPRITKRKGGEVLEEGCLSLPGILVKIKRSKTISVQYMDENNQVIEKEFTDLLARVFQHETDHLNGRLIIDYAGWRAKSKLRHQLQKIEEDSKKGEGI